MTVKREDCNLPFMSMRDVSKFLKIRQVLSRNCSLKTFKTSQAIKINKLQIAKAVNVL